MSNFPRRSPRFQHQAQSYALPDSRNTSTNSSSHPSPTSDNLTLVDQAQQFNLQSQSQFLSPPQFEAPLPSPSASDLDPFGRSYQQYIMSNQVQNQSTQSNTNKQIQANSQQQHQQQHHSSFSQPQRPNFPPTSVNGVPPGLPPDFLAEAAKRAQMACLMRDLGDVSL